MPQTKRDVEWMQKLEEIDGAACAIQDCSVREIVNSAKAHKRTTGAIARLIDEFMDKCVYIDGAYSANNYG